MKKISIYFFSCKTISITILGGLFLFANVSTVSAFGTMSSFGYNNAHGDSEWLQRSMQRIKNIRKNGSLSRQFSIYGRYNFCSPVLRKKDDALSALEVFKKYFDLGQYCKIPKLKERLVGEYLQTLGAYRQTRDPVLNEKLIRLSKIIGLANLWQAAEAERDPKVGPTVTDHLLTARFYFTQALRRDKLDGELNDVQILGFLAGAESGSGQLHDDFALAQEGLNKFDRTVELDPVFGYFGFLIGGLRAPVGSPGFSRAIDYIWKHQDECMSSDVDRNNPDWGRHLPLEENWGCSASELSHRRLEATLLYYADGLAKSGNCSAAETMLKNVSYVANAETWKFMSAVNYRLNDIGAYCAAAQSPAPSEYLPHGLVFESKFRCAVCHQK